MASVGDSVSSVSLALCICGARFSSVAVTGGICEGPCCRTFCGVADVPVPLFDSCRFVRTSTASPPLPQRRYVAKFKQFFVAFVVTCT